MCQVVKWHYASLMNEEYPDKDFPWSFYFNGEVMPKWGACWGLAQITSFLHSDWDAGDLTHRDIYIIDCQIDHVGSVESADPGVFIYAIQEVLHILLSQRPSILASLGDQSAEVYSGLVEAAFRMRELAEQRGCAFWTSGYEADRIRLLDVMRRCQLPPDSPDFTLPPHIQHLRNALQIQCAAQIRRLHQLAQSGDFDKDTRTRLHAIRSS